MNLTLSVDDKTLERARQVARQQGKSLNALVREYLKSLAGTRAKEDIADELMKLTKKHPGRSGGRRVRREDAYAGRS
jgi:hypothetical protein